MVCYELVVLLRVASKPETSTNIKRIATAILDRGGIIRKLENWGSRDTPHKISSHGIVYKSANYFMIEFNLPTSKLHDLKDDYARDIDVVRRAVFRKVEPLTAQCTLQEELLPPPYRKDVQELIAKSRKLDKPKFKYNTGLDYSPFQR